MQGQSKNITPSKQLAIRAGVDLTYKILSSERFRNAYFVHIDMHAGSGINDRIHPPEDGTPITAIEVLRKYNLLDRTQITFCEKDPGRARQLINRLAWRHNDAGFGVLDSGKQVLCADNSGALEVTRRMLINNGKNFRNFSTNAVYGLVMLDPNNPNDGVPINSLQNFFGEFPRVDCCTTWFANAQKRILGANGTCDALCEDLLALKKHWLIYGPIGSWQMIVLLGRNILTGNWRSRGLVELDSEEGKERINRALRTKKEIEEKPASVPAPMTQLDLFNKMGELNDDEERQNFIKEPLQKLS